MKCESYMHVDKCTTMNLLAVDERNMCYLQYFLWLQNCTSEMWNPKCLVQYKYNGTVVISFLIECVCSPETAGFLGDQAMVQPTWGRTNNSLTSYHLGLLGISSLAGRSYNAQVGLLWLVVPLPFLFSAGKGKKKESNHFLDLLSSKNSNWTGAMHLISATLMAMCDLGLTCMDSSVQRVLTKVHCKPSEWQILLRYKLNFFLSNWVIDPPFTWRRCEGQDRGVFSLWF